jgi:TonB family protein
MSGSSSHDSPSRKTQPSEDALEGPSSGATALGRTLEAELTRAATRANPASLTAPEASATPATPAASPVPPVPAVPPATPAGAPADLDLDLISASSTDSGDAAADGDAPAAEDPDADSDADDAQPGATRRPRIGWGGVLALLNVVLSGFILMLWGVPRLDGARIGVTARAKNDGAGANTGARAGVAGGASANRIDRNQAGAASATGVGGTASAAAASAGGGAAGLNAASGPGRGGAGLTGRTAQFGASGVSRATDSQGDAGAGDGAGAGGVDVPELPQAIISVIPGQRAPDVTIPPPPPQPSQPPAARDDHAVAVGGAVKAGADAAIEAGIAAARATGGNTAGNGAASRVPIAGADGVTMPERLAESHVRPTIAALADGEPVSGEVTLAATIRIDGSVTDVQVLSSSRTGAGLEHAAADAVRRWRYKPATRDGQPIDSRLTITVTFR